MEILKFKQEKMKQFEKAQKYLRVLDLRNQLDDALFKADAKQIKEIHAEFKAILKEFVQDEK